MTIRPVTRDDLKGLKGIIEATGLFPAEMLDAMTERFFADNTSPEMWLTLDDGGPVALAYLAPERMTQGTWNLLLIAVHPSRQGQGVGATLTRHIENSLENSGERVLLVETSGLPEFERTRAFYRRLGYGEEARIRDFYQAGEDKVIFRKALAGSPKRA